MPGLNGSGASVPLYGEAFVTDFDEFFAEHYARVVASLVLVCGDAGEAEDAAQVGFTKAMLRWRTVSRYRRPSTWVYVVAVRELRRGLRRRERSVITDDAVDAPAVDPAVQVVTAEVISPRARPVGAASTARGRVAVPRRSDRARGCARDALLRRHREIDVARRARAAAGRSGRCRSRRGDRWTSMSFAAGCTRRLMSPAPT